MVGFGTRCFNRLIDAGSVPSYYQKKYGKMTLTTTLNIYKFYYIFTQSLPTRDYIQSHLKRERCGVIIHFHLCYFFRRYYYELWLISNLRYKVK
jgi:hypothetical protein